jgi:hypothetical protein
MEEITWSDWLDCNQEAVQGVPENSGVFMMHAAMKILYIGASSNLRKAIMDSISSSCTKDAKRFKYSEQKNWEFLKEQLIKEYLEKHEGKLPKCMN